MCFTTHWAGTIALFVFNQPEYALTNEKWIHDSVTRNH